MRSRYERVRGSEYQRRPEKSKTLMTPWNLFPNKDDSNKGERPSQSDPRDENAYLKKTREPDFTPFKANKYCQAMQGYI